MDWVSTVLILLVGVAAGVAVTLWVDNLYWGRRWQTAVSLQKKLREQVRRASRTVAKLQVRSQQQRNALRLKAKEADTLNRQAASLSTELESKGKTLETAVSDLHMTQTNLNRVSEHNETLQLENDAWETKYASSEQVMQTIRTQLHNTQGELSAVRTEKEDAVEKLLTTSAKLQSEAKLNEKIAQQKEQLAQQQTALDAQQAEAQRLNQTVARLREQLQAKVTELETVQGEKTAVGAALSDAEAQQERLAAGLLAQQETNQQLQEKLRLADEALVAVQNERQMAQNEVLGLRRRVSEGQHLRKRLTAVSQDLTAANEELETLKAKLVTQNHIKKSVLHDKDNLTIINGIGPAYARRLNEAGVTSLIDLAKMTPDRVGEIVGVQNWQSRNVQAWIDEANSLIASFSDS